MNAITTGPISFRGIATEIIRTLRPKTVFDAGCAWGLLVEALWDQGVEARGVDISEYAISNLRPDMRPYCRVGSLTEPFTGLVRPGDVHRSAGAHAPR